MKDPTTTTTPPTDAVVEQATKVMHAEVCCPCDPKGCAWAHTPEVRYARALAEAGMLVQPVPHEGPNL